MVALARASPLCSTGHASTPGQIMFSRRLHIAVRPRPILSPTAGLRPHRRGALAAALLLTSAASLTAIPTARAQAILPNYVVTNGQVFAEALSGGTLYFGGLFSRIGPASGGGVPVDAADGVARAGYPKVAGVVRAVVPDGAGGWFVGGAFSAVGGVPRANLARILADHSV